MLSVAPLTEGVPTHAAWRPIFHVESMTIALSE
jgi:hypothetical protein